MLAEAIRAAVHDLLDGVLIAISQNCRNDKCQQRCQQEPQRNVLIVKLILNEYMIIEQNSSLLQNILACYLLWIYSVEGKTSPLYAREALLYDPFDFVFDSDHQVNQLVFLNRCYSLITENGSMVLLHGLQAFFRRQRS